MTEPTTTKTDARRVKIALPTTGLHPTHANVVQLIQSGDDVYMMFGFAEPYAIERYAQEGGDEGIAVEHLMRFVIPRRAAARLRDQLKELPLDDGAILAQFLQDKDGELLDND